MGQALQASRPTDRPVCAASPVRQTTCVRPLCLCVGYGHVGVEFASFTQSPCVTLSLPLSIESVHEASTCDVRLFVRALSLCLFLRAVSLSLCHCTQG